MFDSHNLERLLANIKWKGTYSDNGLLKEWLARRPSLSLFFSVSIYIKSLKIEPIGLEQTFFFNVKKSVTVASPETVSSKLLVIEREASRYTHLGLKVVRKK